MAATRKRHSMAEALKGRDDVLAFLEGGQRPSTKGRENPKPAAPSRPAERRIAVTLRLPENLAHALIDASAERRKNREKAWSQQDIVAEALGEWLSKQANCGIDTHQGL